jgi:predicted RNase H-like HicB family nuclease
MATFIALVQQDDDRRFRAIFPDFPQCVARAPSLDQVIAKAREVLSVHIGRLLDANQTMISPTGADAIERGDALLLVAIEIPDDLRVVHIDLEMPALSLVRIDSFARRHGLTRSALFVEALDHWAALESVPRDRRGGMSNAPTLFDFGNPFELKVETIAANIDRFDEAGKPDIQETQVFRDDSEEVTAELVRLFDEHSKKVTSDEADKVTRRDVGPDDIRTKLSEER